MSRPAVTAPLAMPTPVAVVGDGRAMTPRVSTKFEARPRVTAPSQPRRSPTTAAPGREAPTAWSGAAGRASPTSTSVFGAALESTSGYRRTRQSPSLRSLPSPGSVALRFGAFIIPLDAASLFRPLGALLDVRQADILSLLGFPELLRRERATPLRRADSVLPDLPSVLGQQKTIVGTGGELTFGQLPLIALALVLLSSLLIVGAVVPPGVVARTPFPPERYEALREPLALAAIGVLVPVVVVALAVALA
jgi:hypothetical protein